MSFLRALKAVGRQALPLPLQKTKPPIMPVKLGIKKVVFIGGPGSGKGTFASKLANLLCVPHISIGDLLRQGGALGPHAQAMKEGKLLPDGVVLELLSMRLQQGANLGEDGFILDGFPRTLQQSQCLEEITPIDWIVNMRMRKDLVMNKCIGRRICKECHATFNLSHLNVGGVDKEAPINALPMLPPPECLSKLVQREDDKEEIIRARLDAYYKISKPIEEFYHKNSANFVDVDNEGTIAQTWCDLLRKLNLQQGGNDMQEVSKVVRHVVLNCSC